MFPKLGLLGHPSHVCPRTFLSTVLATVELVSHKGMNNNLDVPFECHHTSIAKEVVEGWPMRKK